MKICLVDIIDACQLKCPTCARGARLMANSSKSMSLDLFRAIVEKAKSEGYDTIGLYNWTEPFLNKNLPEYISVIKEFDCICHVSSNLSLKGRFDTIERSLTAGLDYLIVSVSGYNQEIYEINHRGGKISYVKANLEYISKLLHDGAISTKVCLKFIKFDYNTQEELLLKEYANSLSIGFEIIDGVCHPNTPVNLFDSQDSFLERLKNYTSSSIYEKEGQICSLILDTVSIDCNGYAYLCCAKPNYPILRIGAYLDMTKNDILMKRYTHPACKSCGGYRRKATENDCIAIVGALKSHLGELPAVRSGKKKEGSCPSAELLIDESTEFKINYTSQYDEDLLNRGFRCYKENGLLYTIKHAFKYLRIIL